MYFFERLHLSTLCKVSTTLIKPDAIFEFNDNEIYDSEQESMRYGVWSREMSELNLPSYR